MRETIEQRMPVPGAAWYGSVGLAALAVVLAWVSNGFVQQSREVPAMDEVAFQDEADAVLRAAQQHGYLAGWRASFGHIHAVHSALHRIVPAALSPVLPRSRAVGYVHLYGLQFLAMVCLATFLYRRTGSKALGFLGPAAYLTGAPFGTLQLTPVTDQALDLSSAAAAILVFLAGWRWLERRTCARVLVFGVAFGVAMLHRSICGPQNALLAIAFLAAGLALSKGARRAVLSQAALAAAVALALALPWYLPHYEGVLGYYGAYSYAIGKPISVLEAMAISGRHVATVWTELAALPLVLCALALALRCLRGPAVALVAALFLSPLVPLVVSRSDAVEPVYPTLAALALSPLLVRDARALARVPAGALVPVVLLGAALFVDGARLASLARDIAAMSPQPRLAASRMLLTAIVEVPERPLVVGGFLSDGANPVGLASLLSIEYREPARSGPMLSVEDDFFVEVAQPCDGGRCWEEVAPEVRRAAFRCALERMVHGANVVLVADPELAESARYQFTFFAHVHMAEIARVVDADPRLRDLGVRETIGGIPMRLYAVEEGAEPQDGPCCVPELRRPWFCDQEP